MDCKEVSETLFLFVDNEMDQDLLPPFHDHMARCPGCAQKMHYTRKLLWIVRERCIRCVAPRTLRQRILTSLPHRCAGGDRPPTVV
jgi:mycothiol system anti-sigma-R factor